MNQSNGTSIQHTTANCLLPRNRHSRAYFTLGANFAGGTQEVPEFSATRTVSRERRHKIPQFIVPIIVEKRKIV